MNLRNLLHRVRVSYAANPRLWQVAIVFAAVYFAEGLAQQAGLIGQPLKLYLNETLKLSSSQIALLGWVWYIPVLVKPGLGIITDYIPIRGSRRKLYLILANAITTVGYLVMIGAASWITVSIAMLVTNGGLILATAVTGGLLVENSQGLNPETGEDNGSGGDRSKKFVALQWTCFNFALVLAAWGAGQITEHFRQTPLIALHITGGLSAVAAVGMLVVCWFFLDEEQTHEKGNWKSVGAAIKAGVKEVAETRAIWLAALFIFAYFFSPGMGNPMFLYQVKELHFSQDFIGNLGSLGDASYIVGGVVFFAPKEWMTKTMMVLFSLFAGALGAWSMTLLMTDPSWSMMAFCGAATAVVTLGTQIAAKTLSLRQLLYFSIIAGVLSGITTLWFVGPVSAIVLTITGGILSMVALVAGLAMAAKFCPTGSESFTYAVLMSAHNLCNPLSESTGGYLYDHVFSEKWAAAHHLLDGHMWTIYERLVPMIWISTAFTLLPIFIVPFLKWDEKKPESK